MLVRAQRPPLCRSAELSSAVGALSAGRDNRLARFAVPLPPRPPGLASPGLAMLCLRVVGNSGDRHLRGAGEPVRASST